MLLCCLLFQIKANMSMNFSHMNFSKLTTFTLIYSYFFVWGPGLSWLEIFKMQSHLCKFCTELKTWYPVSRHKKCGLAPDFVSNGGEKNTAGLFRVKAKNSIYDRAQSRYTTGVTGACLCWWKWWWDGPSNLGVHTRRRRRRPAWSRYTTVRDHDIRPCAITIYGWW